MMFASSNANKNSTERPEMAVSYEGTPAEDLQTVVREFKKQYAFNMFVVQTNKTGDRYVDMLCAERHKCMSFVSICHGRASGLAENLLTQMWDTEMGLRWV